MDDVASSPFSLHQVSPGLCSMVGIGGHVYITLALSDRLEVPEEWQHTYSFDNRAVEVLAMAKAAMKETSSYPAPFKVVFPSNLTGKPEIIELQVDIDGDGDLVIDYRTVH